MFNLNQAIGDWRAALSQDASLRPADIEELESHLRDEMEGLAASPLSDEERFLLAARRLGRPAEIHREFAKINGHLVWGQRLFWMAVGVLIWSVLELVSSVVSEACVMVAALQGLTSDWLGVTSFVSKAAILTVLVGLLCISAVRGAAGRKLGDWVASRGGRVALLAGILGVVYAFYFLKVYIQPLIAARAMDLERFAHMSSSRAYASLAWSAIVPIVLTLLVIRFHPSRMKEKEE